MNREGETEAGATLRGRHGEYIVVAEHGRGGFGVTYRARRGSDELPVVVKVLRLDRLGEWKAYDLFERESAVLRELTHPAIPTWLDHFPLGEPDRPNAFALVQTFIEGRTLAEIRRSPGALSRDQMLSVFEELLGVLDYLHRRIPPVIHRDVTPKNVIVRPDGGIALVDFGSVQAVLREGALATTSAGTFGYAAPEQFMGRATPASDLYGAAMTFLAVVSGREPTEMRIDGVRVNVPALIDSDDPLMRLLMAMTDPDPRLRLGDAAVARHKLAQIRRAPTALARTHDGAALEVHRAPTPFLDDLRSRLMREGFAIENGGTVGRTPLELHARRAARPWSALPAFDLYVALLENLEGYPGEGPLTAPAVTLFAQAAGALHGDSAGLLRNLWQAVQSLWTPERTVVTVVASAGGMKPHAAERVEAALPADHSPVIAAAVVVVTEGSVVLMAPAGAWGRVRANVKAYLITLLAPSTAPVGHLRGR